jgi:hypothetical protein
METMRRNGTEILMRLLECSFELVSVHKANKIFIYVSSLKVVGNENLGGSGRCQMLGF